MGVLIPEKKMPNHHADPSSSALRVTGHKRERDSSDSSEGGRHTYVKLFVGSVPRTISEEQVRPMFEEYGDVLEVAIIKDKRTGHQQGCCFVKYASRDEADRAIRCLNNQRTLPGGSSAVQVRYADGERERLGAIEHKLFVGSLNKHANEREIEEIFSPYGRVDDVYIMRDEQKQSRGCAFVKYPSREMAQAAVAALNNVYIMRGCDQPLAVRFADPKRPKTNESSRNNFSPRHHGSGSGSGSNSHRSSGHSGRASPVSWRQANALSLRQLHQSGAPPPFPSSAIAPSHTAPQLPYNAHNQRVHAPEEFIHTALQRAGQAFAGQQAVQFVPLAQHPLHLQQQLSQQQQPQQVHLQPQQFSAQPTQQPAFPPLQHLTQPLAPIQPQLQPSQPPQILQNQQPLHLQNIPPQQQPQTVFQPGSIAQQPHSWFISAPPTQMFQSMVPSAVLPSNWTEHISPEGYKYYYNSVTSESKWEKPDEIFSAEQQATLPRPPPPLDLSFPQFQTSSSTLEKLRQQVWI